MGSYPHFTDEEAEAQSLKASSPKEGASDTQEVPGVGHEGLWTQIPQTTRAWMCSLSCPPRHSPHSFWMGPMTWADLGRGRGAQPRQELLIPRGLCQHLGLSL